MFVPTDDQIDRAVQSLISKLHYIVKKLFKRSSDHFFVTQWVRIETAHGDQPHKGTIFDVRIVVVDDPEHMCCMQAAAENVPGFRPEGTRDAVYDQHPHKDELH